jgi:hypothetical protein
MLDNDKFKILLEAVTNQSEKLDSLHGDFREFKGATAAKVETLEKQASSDRVWGRIQTGVVIPFTVALHQFGAHFGWLK